MIMSMEENLVHLTLSLPRSHELFLSPSALQFLESWLWKFMLSTMLLKPNYLVYEPQTNTANKKFPPLFL